MTGVSARIPPQGTPAQRWAARRQARRRRPLDTKVRALIWFSISLICFAVAVIYLLLPTNHLPQFLPGYDPTANLHETQHAVVSCFCCVVTFLGGLVTLASGGVPPDTRRVRTTPVLREDRTAGRIRSVPVKTRR